MTWRQYPSSEGRGDENGNVEELIGGVWTQTKSAGATNANLATTISGEDQTNDLIVVEQRYAYHAMAASEDDKLGDGNGAAGDFLHTLQIWCPNTAVVSLYDGTTLLFQWSGATDFEYISVTIDAVCETYWRVTTGSSCRCLATGRWTA
jgi:hypothetical protein